MCGIVKAAVHSQINSPSKPDILWKDDNFTAYRETTNPVSSIAHVIIAFKSVPCQSHCIVGNPMANLYVSSAALTSRLYTNW